MNVSFITGNSERRQPHFHFVQRSLVLLSSFPAAESSMRMQNIMTAKKLRDLWAFTSTHGLVFRKKDLYEVHGSTGLKLKLFRVCVAQSLML